MIAKPRLWNSSFLTYSTFMNVTSNVVYHLSEKRVYIWLQDRWNFEIKWSYWSRTIFWTQGVYISVDVQTCLMLSLCVFETTRKCYWDTIPPIVECHNHVEQWVPTMRYNEGHDCEWKIHIWTKINKYVKVKANGPTLVWVVPKGLSIAIVELWPNWAIICSCHSD